MARIRTIKPEFFTSESVCSVSPLARLLFIGMWCEADRSGRMKWKPQTLKIRYLPVDNCDIEKLTEELCEEGMIKIYEVDGGKYCQIPAFELHQVINNRERESDLPPPPIDACPRVKAEGRKEGKGKEGREGKGKEGKELSPSAQSDVREVFDFWHSTLNKTPKHQLTDNRKKAINARLKEFSVNDLKTAIIGCSKSAYHMGKDPRANPECKVYDDLTLIMRNPENVNRFMGYASRVTAEEAREAEVSDWINDSQYQQGEVFDHGQY